MGGWFLWEEPFSHLWWASFRLKRLKRLSLKHSRSGVTDDALVLHTDRFGD